MTELTNEAKEALVTSALERRAREMNEPITGPATELKCTCGGVLHKRVFPPPPKIRPGPRRSKNRRIRKKQLKRWVQTHGRLLMGFHMMKMAAHPMGFRCASCKQHVGFYSAIARNMFK